ncbi:MAG: hypothetical protein WAT97_00770, partial [Gemmiger qucibialis]
YRRLRGPGARTPAAARQHFPHFVPPACNPWRQIPLLPQYNIKYYTIGRVGCKAAKQDSKNAKNSSSTKLQPGILYGIATKKLLHMGMFYNKIKERERFIG